MLMATSPALWAGEYLLAELMDRYSFIPNLNDPSLGLQCSALYKSLTHAGINLLALGSVLQIPRYIPRADVLCLSKTAAAAYHR